MSIFLQMSLTDGGVTCGSNGKSEVIQANSFSFAPNTIDFSSVFSKFDINAQGAVLGSILGLIAVSVIFMVLAHYLDRKAVLQVRIMFLTKNSMLNFFHYLICKN